MKGDPGLSAFSLSASLTTPLNIVNAETVAHQLLIPANTLQVGDIIEIDAMARFSSSATASTTVTRVRIGSAALSGAIAAVNDFGSSVARANEPCMLKAMLVVRSIGTTGATVGHVKEVRTAAASSATVPITVPVAINTTLPLVVAITAISGNAAASITYDVCRISVRR